MTPTRSDWHAPLPPRARRPELDALRGIAALAVVLYHLLRWQSKLPPDDTLGRALTGVFKGGWLGVDLFFVLSGFLITGLLLEARDRPTYYRPFFVRRALRILPLYYASMLVTALVLLPTETVTAEGLLACALFGSNFASAFGVGIPGPMSVYWSLCVEEHFYLLWPALVRLLRPRAIFALCLVAITTTPVARALAVVESPEADIYGLTPFRLDTIALGCALAILVREPAMTAARAARIGGALVGFSLLLGLGMFATGNASRATPIGAALQFSAADLSLAGGFLLITVASRDVHARHGLVRVLAFFGDISFFLYLNHLVVAHLVDLAAREILPGSTPDPRTGLFTLLVRAGVVLGLTTALGAISFRYFEGPILAKKDRLAPR